MRFRESHRYHEVNHLPRPDFTGSPNIDSKVLVAVMKTMNEGSVSSAKSCIGNPDVADQLQFRVELGSKVKAGQRRSLSVDPAAGQHRKRGGFLREDECGVVESSSLGRPSSDHFAMQKSGVSYVMTPRADDTFASRLRITSCKRAEGDCKFGPSKEAEKFLTHANEPLYRFEVKAVEDLEQGPVSVSRERHARPGDSTCNPITMEGERSFVDDHATFRAGMSNHSVGISCALSHDSASKFAAATRGRRFASEPAFADLCRHVAEVSMEGSIGRRVNNPSSHMAETLKWDA